MLSDSVSSSSHDFSPAQKNPEHENGQNLFNSTIKYYIVHSLCNTFPQCISNIYNVFRNNSQN